jgi:hypothetical protein
MQDLPDSELRPEPGQLGKVLPDWIVQRKLSFVPEHQQGERGELLAHRRHVEGARGAIGPAGRDVRQAVRRAMHHSPIPDHHHRRPRLVGLDRASHDRIHPGIPGPGALLGRGRAGKQEKHCSKLESVEIRSHSVPGRREGNRAGAVAPGMQ